MKPNRHGARSSSVWIVATCLVLAGGAACASGGAPLSQTLVLLIGALAAAGLGGLTAGGCGAQKARGSDGGDRGSDGGDRDSDGGDVDGGPDDVPDSQTDVADFEAGDAALADVPAWYVCGEGSLPPGAPGTTGWPRCCLGGQIRACPPPPPTVACNYGWNETYCADGITCGATFLDPCGTGSTDGGGPDASRDSAPDTGVMPDAPTDTPMEVAPAGDATADGFFSCGAGSIPLTDGGMPDGWSRCCMDRQVRWCPPQPPHIACNYGQGQTFCADGLTCGWQTENPCGTADGDSVDGGP